MVKTRVKDCHYTKLVYLFANDLLFTLDIAQVKCSKYMDHCLLAWIFLLLSHWYY